MTPDAFPGSESGFLALWDGVDASVDLRARLPGWPFRGASGCATIYEYDQVLAGSFGAVLHELADAHRDAAVTVAGIEPDPAYYRNSYGFFPAFRFATGDIRTGYGAALFWEPGGDPTGSLGISLNVVAIAGSSGTWAVMAQRDWEVGLLLTPEREGGWLATGVPGFRTGVDLDSIRSPAGWGAVLSEGDRATFARHLRERGSGTLSVGP